MRKAGSIYILFLTLFTAELQAQSSITGKVQSLDGEALPFANVYLDNSSYGTQTDIDGAFTLNIPIGITGDLVASFVGFSPTKRRITTSESPQNITFVLRPKELNEVVISSKRTGKWKRLWKVFEKGFLGQTWRGRQAEILNPEVVQLKEGKSSGSVEAYASEPIEVFNAALGYTIYVDLLSLKSDVKSTFMTAQKRFESLETQDEKEQAKWNRNRSKTYNNSLKKWLTLVANGKEDPFTDVYAMQNTITSFAERTTVSQEIENGFLEKVNPTDLLSTDGNQYKLMSDKPLLFFKKDIPKFNSPFLDAKFEISILTLPNGSFTFDSNGWIIYPNRMILTGFWGNEGIADLLPRDYGENNSISMDLRSVNLETINSKKSSLADTINIDYETAITYVADPIAYKDDFKSVKYDADVSYKIKETDHNLSLLNVIRRMPGVRIMSSLNRNGTQDYAITLSGSNDRPAAIMLDGFIYEPSRSYQILEELRTSNIARIELVKYDTGYFGVRGGAGVIVIYTKGNAPN